MITTFHHIIMSILRRTFREKIAGGALTRSIIPCTLIINPPIFRCRLENRARATVASSKKVFHKDKIVNAREAAKPKKIRENTELLIATETRHTCYRYDMSFRPVGDVACRMNVLKRATKLYPIPRPVRH